MSKEKILERVQLVLIDLQIFNVLYAVIFHIYGKINLVILFILFYIQCGLKEIIDILHFHSNYFLNLVILYEFNIYNNI